MALNGLHKRSKIGVFIHQAAEFLTAVFDGGMVPAAEQPPDLLE